MRALTWLAAAGFVLVASTGCSSAPSGPPPDAVPLGVHDHDHGHPATGPNDGHLIEFQTEDYHAEWLHDDQSGKLTIYILDGPAKAVVPIAAESITIEKKIGSKVETYRVPAADRSEASSKSAKFEITNKPLIEALKSAGQGVDATLTVVIDGQTLTGKFEHHDHGHHHHHKH
jgi:hypothetical protein